ncbi:MAG: hypothetical protein EI684_17380 [Candidatus Viridilinea halotolerans]|uniref:Uncharacterized protein n=1 Tax=Candidatus Viridilinea halotolerans TaxID=2491704 RepID=A0A426TU83_9CHLR|nr:MAG: hypothetical protein EI684_17380 [Candidatus Viridilinea halotolerans]
MRDARELAALLSLLHEQARPRMAGSPAEATMAALVNGRLRRANMGVATYPLRVVCQPGRVYVLLGLLGAAAFVLSPLLPLPSLLLALTLLLALLVTSFGVALPPLGRRGASQTITGVRAIEGAAGLAPRSPRWRLVVLAPLDSSLAWQGLQSIAGPSRRAVLLRCAAVGFVILGSLAALLLPATWWWLLGLPGAIGSLWLALAASQPPTAALPDSNIPALATLLRLAQRTRSMQQVELWVAAVGASASDSRGMALVLSQLPFERENTIFIALEQLSDDQLGLVTSRADDPLLQQLLQDVALPTWPAQHQTTQLAPLLQRHGYRTLSLVTHPSGTRLAEAQLVELATQVVLQMLVRLDA